MVWVFVPMDPSLYLFVDLDGFLLILLSRWLRVFLLSCFRFFNIFNFLWFFFRWGSLQEFRSIATKFIATTIFRYNKTWCYHKMLVHGNRINILPQFCFVALSIPFVAIEAMYCHKLYQHCNLVVILRQLCRVAWIGHSVAIETMYRNKINLCGNIQTYIATIMTCGVSHTYCCKKMSLYCNRTCIGCNMATFCLTFIVLQ